MKSYTVNKEDKYVTIDYNVELSEAEKQDIQFYVSAGYTIRHKSQKKAATATERASKNNLKDADIIKYLKGNEADTNEYISIRGDSSKPKEKNKDNENKKVKESRKGKGFFAAKKWFLEHYEKNENGDYVKKAENNQ